MNICLVGFISTSLVAYAKEVQTSSLILKVDFFFFLHSKSEVPFIVWENVSL